LPRRGIKIIPNAPGQGEKDEYEIEFDYDWGTKKRAEDRPIELFPDQSVRSVASPPQFSQSFVALSSNPPHSPIELELVLVLGL
jgi:hypothetical protein